MKGINYVIFGVLMIFTCISSVYAVSCKPAAKEEIIYYQSDYNVNYCTTTTFSSAGCMPSVYAMVVANLSDSSVTPVTIRDEICGNADLKTQIRGAGGNGPGSASSAFNNSDISLSLANKFQISFTKLGSSEQTLENLKSILKNGDMVVASILCPSPGKGNEVKGCRFTGSSSGHYILLSNVDSNNQIVVLNPGNHTNGQSSWSDETITENVINVVNQGMWLAHGTATTCSKKDNSNEENSGSTSDKHENIFPNIEGKGCGTILIDCDGNPTELNHILNDVFFVMKLAAPILVIVLSTIDYIKALASSNADEIKKTNKRTIMRVVIGLIVFFLPYLLELIFHLFGLYDINIGGIG